MFMLATLMIVIVEEENGSSGAFPAMVFFFACDYEINCLYLPDDCSQMMSFGLLFFEFVVDSLSSHIKWTLCLGIKCWIWVE